jgi:hypothetical protein
VIVELDRDRDGCDPAVADRAAAYVLRHLAAQLETAGYKAQTLRTSDMTETEHLHAVDLALVTLAGAMSEPEITGLVNALRRAATATQEDHSCEFCGVPIEPWWMLVGGDEMGSLVKHTWDQYGYTLCKRCHLAVQQARWQAALEM